MDRKRILITGGAGFIGSHLYVRLRDLGHDVIAMDNFNNHLYRQQTKEDKT